MSAAGTAAEAGVALLIIIGILLALAETPLYPLAFGSVLIAGLYVLLEHPTIIPGLAQWAGSKLR